MTLSARATMYKELNRIEARMIALTQPFGYVQSGKRNEYNELLKQSVEFRTGIQCWDKLFELEPELEPSGSAIK